jgi:hypothetical protein
MVGTGDDWRITFRPDIPSPARIYDFLLGGKDNYPADRDAAHELLAAVPDARMFAQQNRAFLRRAVKYMATEAGIRQFIDIGTGLPTEGNVHELARQAAAGARVVCIDNDPVVLAHGRAMLHGVDDTAIIQHDLRDPGGILADPDLGKLIDFAQPVGLLLVAVLHFISDEENPAGLIGQLMDALPPGSHVALSHATADSRPESTQGEKVYERATAQARARTREQVQALIAGFELVEPGLVWAPLWRPDPDTELLDDPGRSHGYVVLARKP